MTIVSGNLVARATHGVFQSDVIIGGIVSRATRGVFVDTSIAVPDVPTFDIVVSGTTATATIVGDAGVTNYLLYKKAAAAAWTEKSREGSGTIEVTGLECDVGYVFTVYSLDGELPSISAPSQSIIIAAAVDSDFADGLADDASIFITAFDYEILTYRPNGGGVIREINALVDRDGAAAMGAAPHGIGPLFVVTVVNSATLGISTSELDTGGDSIDLKKRLGESDSTRRITRIRQQDQGLLELEVR